MAVFNSGQTTVESIARKKLNCIARSINAFKMSLDSEIARRRWIITVQRRSPICENDMMRAYVSRFVGLNIAQPKINRVFTVRWRNQSFTLGRLFDDDADVAGCVQ